MSKKLIKDSFSLRTLFLIGATLQSLLTIVLPIHYALLPTFALLIHTIATTIHAVITFRQPGSVPTVLSPATHHNAPIPGRTSTRLPLASYDPSKSQTPFTSPPPGGVVVLHLCVRFTHPLGYLAPGGREVAAHFMACNKRVFQSITSSSSPTSSKDKDQKAQDFGCLGYSTWRGDSLPTSNSLLTIYYFRDIAGLNKFAHDRVHREAWEWYNADFVKKLGYSHIGVMHEAFYADERGWESIALNMPPTLLGRGGVLVRNEETGEGEWVTTLVDGRHPKLRSQLERMGRV